MTPSAETAVYALTRQGAMIAVRLATARTIDVYLSSSIVPVCSVTECIPFDSLRTLLCSTFSAYRQHVFITAAGIAVRCIAPHLKDKRIDPAVIVVDQRGKYAISLLSGHLGGANKLARDVALLLGGQAVITTATDTENLPSLDMLALECDLAIADNKAVATINAALLAGKIVTVDDVHNRLQLRHSAWKDLFVFTDSNRYARLTPEEKAAAARVTVSPAVPDATDNTLVLHPKILHVGIGCRRGITGDAIVAFLLATLAKCGLSPQAVAGIASAKVKQDEPGLWEAARTLAVPLTFFSVEELRTVPVTTPSPKARERFGLDGVCEPAAMLAAGKTARLCLPKLAGHGITIAIAEETEPNA